MNSLAVPTEPNLEVWQWERALDVAEGSPMRPLHTLPSLADIATKPMKVIEVISSDLLPSGIVALRCDLDSSRVWALAKPAVVARFLEEGDLDYLKNEAIAFKDLGDDLEVLSEEALAHHISMMEKLGDSPNWMRIRSYHRLKGKSGGAVGELVLKLRGKNYWFPCPAKVWRSFYAKAISKWEGRYKGLRYLQKYIRRWKGYKGRMTKSYYTKNRIPPKLRNQAVSVFGAKTLSKPFKDRQQESAKGESDPHSKATTIEESIRRIRNGADPKEETRNLVL